MRRIGIAFLFLAFANATSFAHYNMLLPDKPWANKGDKVTFTYQFGHPFEHELFDAPKPVGLVVLTPQGKKDVLDIEKTLTKIELPGADKKKVAAWQFTFTPPERGDYTFVLKTPKIKLEDNSFIEDTVRVVLHVQTQNGWETNSAPFDVGYDIWPYTRPYGLLAGMQFTGRFVQIYKGRQVQKKPGGGGGFIPGKPPRRESIFNSQITKGAPIEIEKYNSKPTKNLPPDELITFKAKTDESGFFAATLPEPGWWGVTGMIREKGEKNDKELQEVTLRRATFWLHVDEKK